MITAGVMGATGYMGGEAVRVLLEHPGVELAWATGRGEEPLEWHHPNLLAAGIRCIHPDQATPCDVVFLALPTDASLEAAARFLEAGSRVVDLGAAFRLEDRAVWEETYGRPHTRWSLAEEAVYGLPELHREAISLSRLVANPGCFSSSAILALAPLVAEGWIDPDHIVVNGLSGTAGAGAELARPAHHPEIGGNLVAYNVVGHRHTREMEQELSRLAADRVCVHFTPVYVPIVRGILDVCSAFPTRSVSRCDVVDLLRGFHRESPFVEVFDLPPEEGATWQYRPYPWVSAVAGTNRCQIGVDVDEERGRIVLLSALDSIGKGGAHVGVENMNLMFGLPRTQGLLRLGAHP
ncbi:MAG: N-acetyl-gamma-glutamyl-phosphate reductase [Myxococcota bacterium]